MKTFIIAGVLGLGLAGTGWAEECWEGNTMTADVNPGRDARIAACEKRNFQQAVREAMKGDYNSFIVDENVDGLPPFTTSWQESSPFQFDAQGVLKTDSACVGKMEAAMRAMDTYIPKFVDPVERRRYEKMPSNTITLPCHNCYVDGEEWIDTRSIEQKLQADKARYEREQEDRGRQIVEDAKERWAYQEWDAVKRECWRQP